MLSPQNCWNDDHADRPYPWERHSGWTMPEIRRQFSRDQGDGPRIISIDASDAGKVAFLLTGIEDTSPQLYYEIMKAPVRTHR